MKKRALAALRGWERVRLLINPGAISKMQE